MREIYARVAERLQSGRRCAVATLLEVRNAKPAPIGTSLIVDDDGSFIGNIGAGCHEAEIVVTAQSALQKGETSTLEFDLDDELVSGSICGASLRVAVWIPDRTFLPVAQALAHGESDVQLVVAGVAIRIPKRRRLVVVGATDLGAELTKIAHAVDFHVTIVDPRPVFATQARHPHADEIVVAWPDDVLAALIDERSSVVVIAHDVKIDMPALRSALASPAQYIGVLGSRRAQRARFERLRSEGYTDAQLRRIFGPTGLDIGGETAAAVAVSIVAEVLAVCNDRGGASLHGSNDSIHALNN